MSYPVRPSLHSRIRDLIPTAETAKRPREMTTLLPDADADQVRESVGCMFRSGILDRVGNRSEGFRYFVVRAPAINAYATKEVAEAARKERERQRWARGVARDRRCMPMDEWRAEQARRAAATRARNEAARRKQREALQAKREAERVRMIAAKLEAAHRRQEQAKEARELAKAPVATLPHTEPPARKAARVETLDEYKARGGRVERLPSPWVRRVT